MKTYDIVDEHGRLTGFEVSNLLLSRHEAARIVEGVPGVTITRPVRRLFSSEPESDEFCEFRLENLTFVLCEPFGDNSRYWVGSQTGEPSNEVERVREAFLRVSPLLRPSGLARLAILAVIIASIFANLWCW